MQGRAHLAARLVTTCARARCGECSRHQMKEFLHVGRG